jgi:hypothetical protein
VDWAQHSIPNGTPRLFDGPKPRLVVRPLRPIGTHPFGKERANAGIGNLIQHQNMGLRNGNRAVGQHEGGAALSREKWRNHGACARYQLQQFW